MYTVTFYSFKGGVGRTMALTNVAYELAREGKRVLIVDFDLEAPGLDTIEVSISKAQTPGIVEYVLDYLDTGESPCAAEYMYQVDDVPSENGRIWVMPAGRADDNYAYRLSRIDWGDLYANHDGFLLFEDLKAQWQAELSPDYVLIDSRTGHTDVGGICTRQLPDAVTILFIPNEQNLRGLTKVVRDIREESVNGRIKRKELLFVMSNVPDIDDEDDILRDKLQAFQRQLRFRPRDLVSIHRYDSLVLLNQAVFTRDRRKSRLAREYRLLTSRIAAFNPADPKGALRFIDSVSRQRVRLEPKALEERLEDIRSENLSNGEVLNALGEFRLLQGRLDESLSLFQEAEAAGYRSAALFLNLAEGYQLAGNSDAAIHYAARVFELEAASYVLIERALEFLRSVGELDSASFSWIPDSPALLALSAGEQIWLATSLNRSVSELHAARGILERLRNEDPDLFGRKSVGLNPLALALIGLGECEEAAALIRSAYMPSEQLSIADAFNLAMAKWGATGEPDRGLFTDVIRADLTSLTDPTPNIYQCLALTCALTGHAERAREFLVKAGEGMRARAMPEFSCWRYLRVAPEEFLKDLESMEVILSGYLVPPLFATKFPQRIQ